MNNLAAFVRMEFITAKPYMTGKVLIAYAGLLCFMTVMSTSAATLAGFSLMIATLNLSFIFATCEKNNMDALYVTLAVKKRTVVLGRYLFSLFMDVCAILCALLFSLVLGVFVPESDLNMSANEALPAFTLIAAMFLVVQAVQFPIFFRFGYMKAKYMSIIPFLLIVAGLPVLERLRGLPYLPDVLIWAASNIPAVCALICAVTVIIICVSYRLSLAFYGKRDF
jgi:hypothetical protein